MSKKLILACFVCLFYVSLSAQRRTSSGDFDEPFRICFNNKTSKTVWVALRYMDTDGEWRTKYWFKYKPYENDRKNNGYVVKTNNRIFYYYARTKSRYNGDYYYWGGKDNYKYIDGKQVGMKKKHIKGSGFEKRRGQKYCIGLN